MTLKLYLIEQDSADAEQINPQLIAELHSDSTQIGREPAQGGITLNYKSVSRNHGTFTKIDKFWFFRDLGSSNGSWLNGQHLSADKLFLLRSGDELQLADSFLGINIEEEQACDASVLVFSRGDFHSEIVLPDSGKVLSVGGSKSDFKLDVDLGVLPQFVLEIRTGILCVYPISSEHKSLVNGKPLEALVQLKDRDYVEVGSYRLVVNSSPSDLEQDSQDSSGNSFFKSKRKELSGWEEDEKQPLRTFFGQLVPKSQESSLDPAKIVSSSPRKKTSKLELLEKLYSIEESLAFIFGFLLIILILGIVLWWFLR